jgi:hydroxymethylbilane synthase
LIRVGTRASALALAQAEWVLSRLGRDAELVPITTAGDRGVAVEDKSRWTSELERALLDGRIDLAVHSAKDVPSELADGLALVAIPERADPRDAICGAGSLAALAPGAKVGTSSIRRAAQIRAARQDLEIVAVRGNVDTRLRKLQERQFDALVLAYAGLQRLGRMDQIGGLLTEFVPAPGQGALAIEACPGAITSRRLAPLIDAGAMACVTAERELVRALGASCHTPVGAHANALPDGTIELRAWAGLPDGSAWVIDRRRGRTAGLGNDVAARMLAAGAGELLQTSDGSL